MKGEILSFKACSLRENEHIKWLKCCSTMKKEIFFFGCGSCLNRPFNLNLRNKQKPNPDIIAPIS